jgi:hypothetical protein
LSGKFQTFSYVLAQMQVATRKRIRAFCPGLARNSRLPGSICMAMFPMVPMPYNVGMSLSEMHAFSIWPTLHRHAFQSAPLSCQTWSWWYRTGIESDWTCILPLYPTQHRSLSLFSTSTTRRVSARRMHLYSVSAVYLPTLAMHLETACLQIRDRRPFYNFFLATLLCYSRVKPR